MQEYREFLALGHGEVFELDIDAVVDAPWRFPGTDPGDFFNYGFNERTWKQYTDRVKQFRMEYTLRNQIQTLDQARYGPGAQHQAPQQQRRWGEEGGAGGDAGDQGVLAVGSESRDEHYESFVTSERPPVSSRCFASAVSAPLGFHGSCCLCGLCLSGPNCFLQGAGVCLSLS